MTVWFAAQFVCDHLGFQHVILEGDSLSVISYSKKARPCESDCGQLIFDTKIILSRLLHFDFQHVKMDANKMVHYMAKFALFQLLDKAWTEACLCYPAYCTCEASRSFLINESSLFLKKKKKKKKKKVYQSFLIKLKFLL
jgi:hypothetical protein